MGRTGSGVEPREHSIRLTFVYEGQSHRETLMINGKPMAPTPSNLRFAERLAMEIRDKIRHDTFSMAEYFPASGKAGALAVATQLDNWLAAQRIEESTRAGYISAAKFWKETFGDKPLRALKHSDILTAIATRPDLSGKTINNRVSVLRKALQMAVLDKVLTDNPATHIESAKWEKQPVDPFTPDERDRIIAAMRDPAIAAYTKFRFWTGLRSGESYGLRWPNVDLKGPKPLIQVSESIVRGIEKKSTKTNLIRIVKLNPEALATMQEQRTRTALAGEHVWINPNTGRPWTDHTYRDVWAAALKRAGVRHRRPYNTRHTYATMLLMLGMKPAFCAAHLGHSRIMFDQIYSKWLPDVGDDAEMAKFFPGTSPDAASTWSG